MSQPRLNTPPPPSAPRPTGLRAPRLRLSPIRQSQSLRLDGQQVRPRGEAYELPLPPYQQWAAFKRWYGELWQAGSLGVTMVAATQRPRAVPLNTFEQAIWTFLWRVSDRDDRRRASEFTGVLSPVVFETAGRLPRNEFLCVNSVDDLIVRSRVRL